MIIRSKDKSITLVGNVEDLGHGYELRFRLKFHGSISVYKREITDDEFNHVFKFIDRIEIKFWHGESSMPFDMNIEQRKLTTQSSGYNSIRISGDALRGKIEHQSSRYLISDTEVKTIFKAIVKDILALSHSKVIQKYFSAIKMDAYPESLVKEIYKVDGMSIEELMELVDGFKVYDSVTCSAEPDEKLVKLLLGKCQEYRSTIYVNVGDNEEEFKRRITELNSKRLSDKLTNAAKRLT